MQHAEVLHRRLGAGRGLLPRPHDQVLDDELGRGIAAGHLHGRLLPGVAGDGGQRRDGPGRAGGGGRGGGVIGRGRGRRGVRRRRGVRSGAADRLVAVTARDERGEAQHGESGRDGDASQGDPPGRGRRATGPAWQARPGPGRGRAYGSPPPATGRARCRAVVPREARWRATEVAMATPGFSLGVHVGQQNMPVDRMRAVWRRGRRGRARLAVVLGPPVRGPSGRRNARPLRGPDHPRRDGGRDQQRPPRVPRLLRRVPQPRPAREGRHHARPPLRRPVRAGPRRRLARAGGGGVRLRLPVRRHPARHARGGGPHDPVAAQRGADDGPRHPLPGGGRVEPPGAGRGSPSHLGGRHRQAADPADRRPMGRRLERRLRRRRRLRRPRRRARPVVRRRGAGSGVASSAP